ncbi:MAG TPA: caspase family protein, partial [Trebonia sp.]|nr:caspase family protein [Trebonia sp.]
MVPDGTPALSSPPSLPADHSVPGGRSALLITTAAYADVQLAWLRPPVSGAADLAAALASPRAGGFTVEKLADGTETEIRLAVGRFLAGRSASETVLIYLACHAIRDRARLYFAATDTWLRYPQRSAVPASFILGELDLCGAGTRMLILDCCFSGGFADENGELDLAAEFGLAGRGIAVLSGTGAREYSYEGRAIGPELPRSVFTEGLAVGLATGAADADGDGIVTLAEGYNYAYRHVTQYAPRQTPKYYLEDGQGGIVLGRATPVTPPYGNLMQPRPAAKTPGRMTAEEPPSAGGARGHADAEARPGPGVPGVSGGAHRQSGTPQPGAGRGAGHGTGH